MTGTVMNGEDVVQDALFQAYRKLDTFDDMRPFAPWLFRMPTIDVSISCVAMRFGRKLRQPSCSTTLRKTHLVVGQPWTVWALAAKGGFVFPHLEYFFAEDPVDDFRTSRWPYSALWHAVKP
jgi:hypothetical protein